jgi:hypothetical protein
MSSGLAVRIGAVGRAPGPGVVDLEPLSAPDWEGARFFGAVIGERSLDGVDDPAKFRGRAMVVEEKIPGGYQTNSGIDTPT